MKKIILTMNLPYFPAHGGANKSSRALAEGLAGKGYQVRIVVPALGTPSKLTHGQFIEALNTAGITVHSHLGADVFCMGGVEVHAVDDPMRLRAHLVEQIRDFSPDWILVSAEDPSQNLFDAAVKSAPSRVIYIVQTPTFLPFGPQAFFPSERRAQMLRQATQIVALSNFTKNYIREYGGLDSTVIHMPVYGTGPFPNFGRFDGEYVTLVNPCAMKGISIFLALARALPEIAFAAVPTWGTTPKDIDALTSVPNVTILEPNVDFDQILSKTRLLLMPSLWQEAFGYTTMEAMLRGIPVVAANVGGIPEAKLGTDFLLPVRPIERFTEQLDGNQLPVAVVPEQDIAPWREAVSRLLSDRTLYERQSAIARGTSARFVSGIGVEPFEGLFARLEVAEKEQPRVMPTANAEPAAKVPAGLTPDQQALLMLRLRKTASGRAAQAATVTPK